MKKIYKRPSSCIISISSEAPILSSSLPQNHMNIGCGNGTEKGQNALVSGKGIWGNEINW